MNGEPGAYIEKDGAITPDLTDEAMVARQPKDEKTKPAKGKEVSIAEK